MDDRVRESLEVSRESAVAQREELDGVIAGLDKLLARDARGVSKFLRGQALGSVPPSKKKRGRPAKDKTPPSASKLSRGALFGAVVEAVKNAEGPVTTHELAKSVGASYASVYGALRSKGKAAGVTPSGKGSWLYKTPASQAPVKRGTTPKPEKKIPPLVGEVSSDPVGDAHPPGTLD